MWLAMACSDSQDDPFFFFWGANPCLAERYPKSVHDFGRQTRLAVTYGDIFR